MSCVFDTGVGPKMNQISVKEPDAETELDQQEMGFYLYRIPSGIQVTQADKYDTEPQKLAAADDSGEGGGKLLDYPNNRYEEDSEDEDGDAATYGFDQVVHKYLLTENMSPSPPNETAKPVNIHFGNTKPDLRDVTGPLLVKPKKEVWERRKGQVLMEGFVEEPISNESDPFSEGIDTSKCFSRTKSLTDEDLDELKGCLDLGFGFNYEEIPELCNTLPALELCYSISQRFQDEQQRIPASTTGAVVSSSAADACSNSANSCLQSPIASWRISSPGDCPEQVKERLKFWAQAVACTKVGLGENFLTGLFTTQKLSLSITREWETHCNVIWASFKTWLRFRDLDFMAESRACCGATMGRKATRVARRRKITLGQV